MSSRAERAQLRPLAEAMLLDVLGAVSVARLCPRCGSDGHGRPVVRLSSGPPPSVSLSYARDLAVVAWSWDGLVGADVELAAAGPPDRGAWTRLEARAKALGEGLTGRPVADQEVWTQPLSLPPAYVGHLAVAGGGPRPVVSWRAVGPAAAPRAATA